MKTHSKSIHKSSSSPFRNITYSINIADNIYHTTDKTFPKPVTTRDLYLSAHLTQHKSHVLAYSCSRPEEPLGRLVRALAARAASRGGRGPGVAGELPHAGGSARPEALLARPSGPHRQRLRACARSGRDPNCRQSASRRRRWQLYLRGREHGWGHRDGSARCCLM